MFSCCTIVIPADYDNKVNLNGPVCLEQFQRVILNWYLIFFACLECFAVFVKSCRPNVPQCVLFFFFTRHDATLLKMLCTLLYSDFTQRPLSWNLLNVNVELVHRAWTTLLHRHAHCFMFTYSTVTAGLFLQFIQTLCPEKCQVDSLSVWTCSKE